MGGPSIWVEARRCIVSSKIALLSIFKCYFTYTLVVISRFLVTGYILINDDK